MSSFASPGAGVAGTPSPAGLPAELTFATVPGLLGGADALARSGPVLDLSPVRRMDSAGVSFLLELTRRARTRGQPLAFAHLSPQARGLIGFLGLDDLLTGPGGSPPSA